MATRYNFRRTLGPKRYIGPKMLKAGQQAGGATTTPLQKSLARKAKRTAGFVSQSDPTAAYAGIGLAAAGWKKKSPVATQTGAVVKNLNPIRDHEVAYRIGLESGTQQFEFRLRSKFQSMSGAIKGRMSKLTPSQEKLAQAFSPSKKHAEQIKGHFRESNYNTNKKIALWGGIPPLAGTAIGVGATRHYSKKDAKSRK